MSITSSILRRCFSTSGSLNNVINHVTVVGGGLMGSGIAQVTAQSGMNVTIVEVNDEALKKADDNIKKSIQRVAKKIYKEKPTDGEKFVEDSLSKLKYTTDLRSTVFNTDLVIEAIVEDLEVKRKLFTAVDEIAPPHTIFASNTSSLPISEIASPTKRKDRFGGLHFFNPVPVMKLLEVIRIPETSQDTYNKMLDWGKRLGKTTITCKDTPGFVVNRLLGCFLREALLMLERGDATARDIDTAMKLGAGHPMGPFELCDYVGLDTQKKIQDIWHERFPDDPRFVPSSSINKLVSEGKFGVKTGEGFYTYKK